MCKKIIRKAFMKGKNLIKQLFNIPYRDLTHGEMIELVLRDCPPREKNAVFVEIGSGFTTLIIAQIAKRYDALFYSLDNNLNKIEDIKKRIQNEVDNINFLAGDSHESLPKIIEKHHRIHFIFFDSAPSAMHTFQEFLQMEKNLKPGSCIIIDNAAMPGQKALLTPCRKGKILVPYLLASPYWKVFGHPHAGDSMVSAIYQDSAEYAHPDYELYGWKDSWEFKE